MISNMKMFLLMAGEGFYPKQSTGNWIDTFDSYEGALSKVEDTQCGTTMPSRFERYRINGKLYDWYSIIDLNKWCNKND